jgi:hypothetical protein
MPTLVATIAAPTARERSGGYQAEYLRISGIPPRYFGPFTEIAGARSYEERQGTHPLAFGGDAFAHYE